MEQIKRIPYFGSLFLLAYMPFHIFLSQSLSLATGSLNGWKIGKDILTFGVLILSVGLVLYFKKATVYYKKILLLATCYLLLHLIVYWLRHDNTPLSVAALATVYNNRLFWYFLIGLSAVRLLPKTLDRQKLIKWFLIISSVVALVGVVQYFLPKDILTHIGYSIERGARPNFLIDNKSDLPRIMSTLRDPNSLGAYLILPITLLTGLIISKNKKLIANSKLLFTALMLHLAALGLTFSRSAWLGAAASVVLLFFFVHRLALLKFVKKYWLFLVFSFLLLTGGAYMARDQYFVQNVISHGDENTQGAGSTQKHLSYTIEGTKGILQKPLGHGPGTAGSVALKNPSGGLSTENYFIQIGYEVGLIGLALFIAATVFIYKKLSSNFNLLSSTLMASFWGLVLCNLFLHTWSNEAVAASWWLLAGLAIKE